VLDLGDLPWAGVPCWTGRAERWVYFTVPVAYAARYDTHVRPAMPGNPTLKNHPEVLDGLVRLIRSFGKHP